MSDGRRPGDMAADIVGLVIADHARVDRLFRQLERGQVRRASPADLAAGWTELSVALVAHFDAFEEILALPLIGTAGRWLAMSDLSGHGDDIHDAAADARLSTPGSLQWWLAVRAARATASQHVNLVESVILPRFRQRTPERARRELARQWHDYMDALARDSRGEAEPR